MRLTRAGGAAATVVVSPTADRVETTAARLLVDEVRERTGVTLPISSEDKVAGGLARVFLGTPATLRAIADAPRCPESHPAGESIAIGFSPVDIGETVFAVGSGSRGVLYAAVELLDHICVVDGDAELPPFEVSHAPSFPVRAWQQAGAPLYHPDADDHVELFRRNIAAVARRRGNAICLGQDFPDSSSALVGYRHFQNLHDPLLEPELERRREVARGLVADAAAFGIDVYLQLVEFRYPATLPERHPDIVATPPDGSARRYEPPPGWGTDLTVRRSLPPLCASHPVTWAWYRAKVREIFEVVPDAAGLELWVSWADSDIFYCACADCAQRSPTDRLERIVDESLAAMDAAGAGPKRLLLSTYLGGWRQILEDEIFRLLAGRLDPRVIVRHKSQLGDFYLGSEIPPLAGAFQPDNGEVVEFDLAGEYRAGMEWGVVARHSEYVAERARAFRARGASGLIQRHLDWRNDLTAAEFDAFYALAWDVDSSVEAVWTRWAVETFGLGAGPAVLELLADATRVVASSMYVRGVSLGGFRLFPEGLQRLRHLTIDRSARSVPGGLDLIRPTEENIRLIIEEKDRAVELASSMLRRVERLSGQISARHHRALSQSIGLQYELSLVYRSLAELFWRFLAWEATLSEVEREWQREDLLCLVADFRGVVDRFRGRVPELWNAALFKALGTAPARWRDLRFDTGLPVANLDAIALDIERELDVQPASMWGYVPAPRRSGNAEEPGGGRHA